jgi:hypothetical protein
MSMQVKLNAFITIWVLDDLGESSFEKPSVPNANSPGTLC